MSTKIEWTHRPGTKGETWNPIVGCSEVSPGCRHCYAAGVAHRGMQEAHRGLTVLRPNGVHWNGTLRPLPERLDIPLRWKKPRTVFVCSMSDLFHEDVSDQYVAAVFGVMAACPQHTFIVLTKRAQRMRDWFEWAESLPYLSGKQWRDGAPVTGYLGEYAQSQTDGKCNIWRNRLDLPAWPLPNVWLGVSAEDQERAEKRIPVLMQCQAAVHWVSAEPLLGPINLRKLPHPNHGMGIDLGGALDWVVAGGESGPGARPCHLDWIEGLIAQCAGAGVPVFNKQLGSWYASNAGLKSRKGADPDEWHEGLRVRQYPEAS